MKLLDWLFGNNAKTTDKRKRVFISFAIEDVIYRDYLVEQARRKNSTFDFIDMSVKREWSSNEWKDRCRTRIRKCDGVIALLSKNTHKALGAKWEIKCAREEGLKIIGMHIRKNDKGTVPIELQGKRVVIWSWENLEKFINKL